MISRRVFVVILFLVAFYKTSAFSQDIEEDKAKKFITWSLLQLIPSPTVFQDSDGGNSRVQFGFKWQVIPLNISFNANKFVSSVQFFMINPVRRFTGSAEIFIQPELATSSFKYYNTSVFGINTGGRLIFPIYEKGENLCFSIGGTFTYRKNYSDEKDYYYGIQGGLYIFGGQIGLQYNHNFETRTKYNLSLYIKYF